MQHKIINALGSRRFLRVVLVFFVFEALWFVCTALYPMAFDEDFHFGLIKIYADHWLPFLGSQPPGADAFGAVARDPSYLYHYLMSFPYRFVHLFTDSQTAIVICLRLINVALFTTGIVLFVRLLRRLKLSAALVHLLVVIFVLIPVVPMLAAHINYDNLLIPLSAWLFLLGFAIADRIKQRQVPVKLVAVLTIVSLLTALVKYPALPIIGGLVLILTYLFIRTFRHRRPELWPALKRGYAAIPRRTLVVLACLLVLASGLFAQRYGVNAVRYHSAIPDCQVVLTVEQCKNYGPWRRNYNMHNMGVKPDGNVLSYFYMWVRGLHHRLFFVVNSSSRNYATRLQLPLPAATALVLVLASVVLVAVFWKRVFAKNTHALLLVAVIATYCVALFLDGYSQYQHTAQPVAINGRYLLPLMLPMLAIMGMAWRAALAKYAHARAALAVAVVALFLQGGGVMTFILRSDDNWEWPNRAVVTINDAARDALRPIIYEGKSNVD